MKKIVFFTALLLSSFSDAKDSLLVAAERCSRPVQAEPLFQEDIRLRGYASPQELVDVGQALYRGEKRHPGAFYYSAEQESFVGARMETSIRVPSEFIRKILSHLSAGLSRNYARSLYHADWGHGHFFLPLEEYRKNVDPLPGGSQELYDALLNSKNLMVIYHAAEQMLKAVDGQPIQDEVSRYYIDRRNILGSFSDEPETSYLPPQADNLHNTQSGIKGYYGYGGIEFTWNKNGCFPVQNGAETVYIDLSFEFPPLKDSSPEPSEN